MRRSCLYEGSAIVTAEDVVEIQSHGGAFGARDGLQGMYESVHGWQSRESLQSGLFSNGR